MTSKAEKRTHDYEFVPYHFTEEGYDPEIADQEEREAAKRVLKTPEETMEWLVTFAKTDLTTLPKGQRWDLETEVFAFLRFGPPFEAREVSLLPPVECLFASHDAHSRGGSQILQQELKGWLGDLMTKGKAELPSIKLSYDFAHRNDKKLSRQPWSVRIRVDNLHHLFAFHVSRLIAKYIHRLRLCLECSTTFLAYRGAQKYCSSTCLNRALQKRFRDRSTKKKQRRPPTRTTTERGD